MRVSTRSLSVLVSSFIGLLVGGSVESMKPGVRTAHDLRLQLPRISSAR